MKKFILSLSLLVAGCISMYGQGYQWGKRLGSYGVDFGNAITTDASGNVYVTGQFEFDGFFNGDNTSSFTASGTHDIFVAKYSPSGTLLWVRQAGGKGGDAGVAICTDAGGNVYITGEMEDTCHFGAYTIYGKGSNDAFIAKYDPNGTVQWAVRAGGYSGDRGRAIAVDASGSVYLTGEFRNNAEFGSITVSTSGIYKDFFLAKYVPGSGWAWVKQGGSSEDDEGKSLAFDNSGNIIVTGFYRNNANFDGVTMTTPGGSDIFLAKYATSTGALQWIKRAGGVWDDEGRGVAYNSTDDLIYVAGEYRGTSDFGSINMVEAGYGDAFVACYTSGGTELWVKSAGGTATDYARAIDLDNNNNIYITGAYSFSTTFSPGVTLTGDTSEVFIASFDKGGTFRWVVEAKGTGKEDMGRGVAVDNNGNIYIVGNYNERTGGPTEELMVGMQPLMGYSNEDSFIAKYSQSLVGIKEDLGQDPISFYPNPASDQLLFRSFESGIISIENELGQTVFSRAFKTNESFSLPVDQYKKGMYFVRSGSRVSKLVIE